MQPIFINFMKIIDFLNQVHYISFTAIHTKQIILYYILFTYFFNYQDFYSSKYNLSFHKLVYTNESP